MLTLLDVRNAVSQGERKQAVEMLKIILDESPSADAWYYAARLTKNQENAVKYLRHALLINPRHEKSLALMEKLGGKPRGFFGHIGEELVDILLEQSKKSPLLKHFKPRQQLIAIGIMTIVIVIAFALVLANLLNHSSQSLYVPETAPQAAKVVKLNVNQVVDNFVANGYEVVGLKITNKAGTAAGQTASFNYPDHNGTWHAISVRVYRDLSALISDQDDLNAQEAAANVLAVSNAVLIYPKSLEGFDAERLVTTFNLLGVK